MNAFIEERVREMPEQYYWVHKRFKTRPPGEAKSYERMTHRLRCGPLAEADIEAVGAWRGKSGTHTIRASSASRR